MYKSLDFFYIMKVANKHLISEAKLERLQHYEYCKHVADPIPPTLPRSPGYLTHNKNRRLLKTIII